MCLERNSMGVKNGCAVGGPARAVSFVSALPSPVSAIGSLWSDEGEFWKLSLSILTGPGTKRGRLRFCWITAFTHARDAFFQASLSQRALGPRGDQRQTHPECFQLKSVIDKLVIGQSAYYELLWEQLPGSTRCDLAGPGTRGSWRDIFPNCS